ncbi:MAG: glycosyltransferase family 2 protein [Bacteriovoracaceae bacterium]
MQVLFFTVFALIVIHYVGFGLMVLIASLFFKRNHISNLDKLPTVSFIVAAYNEEKVIREKIENDLLLDYPKDKIELIIVSDGSNDKTAEIASSYASRGVVSLHKPERGGKTAALNRAIALAKNEILVFSDANSMFQKDAIKKLMAHFADDSIGGVCGQKTVLSNKERRASLGDHLYWQYESRLKQAESHLGSIPTADGEIFAMRKSLYKEVDAKIINDDQVITLNILKQGKRVIYEKNAISYEEASISLKDDFNVKARMVYGGIQIMSLFKEELNPFKSWFGLQFFFHKTLRYFMWALLILIFVSNLAIIHQHEFYRIFFGLQLAFYLLAVTGGIIGKFGKVPTLFYIPNYYCTVNIAAFKGYLFFRKQRKGVDVWKKAKR